MIDFDPSTPGDSDIVANYPANERAERQKLQDWSEVDHYEVDGKHRAARFKAQADPTVAAGEISIYAKTVSGKAEIHIKDEDGNVVKLTEGAAFAAMALVGLTVSGNASVAGTLGVGGTSTLAAATLSGLLTLGAHLKTSLTSLDLLRADDVVGVHMEEVSPTEQLLQVLTDGAMRNVLDAKKIAGRDWTATGQGTDWDVGIDLSGSYTDTASPPSVTAEGGYIKLGGAMMYQYVFVRFAIRNPGGGEYSGSINYPIAFGGAPYSVTPVPVRSTPLPANNDFELWRGHGSSASVLSFGFQNEGGGSVGWMGMDVHAIGPLP